jgi:HEAT repeat protein
MKIYFLFIFIIFLEFLFFMAQITLILTRRLFDRLRTTYLSKTQKKLSLFLMRCITHPQKSPPEALPLRLRSFKNLLLILESFDHRLKGESWEILKFKIAALFLLDRAKKMVFSPFWTRRQLAARAFALAPQNKYESSILKLLDDKKFLVRANAAKACFFLASEKTIYALLKKMSLSLGYERSFYRDLFLQKNRKAILILETIVKEEKDFSTHCAALDILSTQASFLPLSTLKKDLRSNKLQIRLLALKTLGSNPQAGVEKILLRILKKKDPQERAEALWGLRNFPTPTTLRALTHALHEDLWSTRYPAAKALKSMGSVGIKILQNQSVQDKKSYETSRYVLQFD